MTRIPIEHYVPCRICGVTLTPTGGRYYIAPVRHQEGRTAPQTKECINNG
jgi:hypothetical protein